MFICKYSNRNLTTRTSGLFGRYRTVVFVGGMSNVKPLVVSGPSGSGKSTLVKKLMAEYKNRFGFTISHTTRKPRPGEVDGKDYYFCSRDLMEKAISNGEFLEHAEYAQNLYGTSKKAVQDVIDEGKNCIMDIDRQGVLNVKNTDLDCFYMFVKPPSMEELERRLRNRKTETEESLQRRLNIAKSDMEYAEKPDSYDYIVVNDDLDKSYARLKELINEEIFPLT